MSPPDSLGSRLADLLAGSWYVWLGLAIMLFGDDVTGLEGVWLWIGIAVIVLGALLEDVKAYSLGTVGTAERVDVDAVEADDDGSDVHCSVCGAAVETGERRTYAKQTVLFGLPLRTLEWGENAYCEDCLGPTPEDPAATSAAPPIEREPSAEADRERSVESTDS